MTNPFTNGNPVFQANFYGRKNEIRRLKSRVFSSQSTAVVGEPRSGKTSIFLHLENSVDLTKIVSKEKSKKIFLRYIDIHCLSGTQAPADFWENALKEVYEKIIVPNPDELLTECYYSCKKNGFQTRFLESFLNIFEKNNYQLVLMLDEVDSFIHFKNFNTTEFFGSLRSLASRIDSFSIIIASRYSVNELNKSTQALNPTGSPFFNIYNEVTLGPLALAPMEDILKLGDKYFTSKDKRFIKEMSGAQPYLLQSASSELWELYLDDEYQNEEKRLEQLHEKLSNTANRMMSDTWKLWSAPTKMAMAIIALSQAPELILTHRFDNRDSFHNINNMITELKMLKSQGFIKEDSNSAIGWVIRPKIFVYWVTEEITRSVRNKTQFESWIQAQEWDGILTKKEKTSLSRIGSYVADILKELPKVLVKAVAD